MNYLFYCFNYRRRIKQKKSKATVFITSGAMTFLVLSATLVTATFLFSPKIEQIFGKNIEMFRLLKLKKF